MTAISSPDKKYSCKQRPVEPRSRARRVIGAMAAISAWLVGSEAGAVGSGAATQPGQNASSDEAANIHTPVRQLRRGFYFLAPHKAEVRAGGGPALKPDYMGSDDYEVEFDPQFFLKLGDFHFLDDEAVSLALIGLGDVHFGPSVSIVGDRDEDDNDALTGLGDVGRTFELGAFARMTLADRYVLRLAARRGVASGHRGVFVSGDMTALVLDRRRVSMSVSAVAAWAGEDYSNTYFSVSPEQSAVSGLPEFETGNGFHDVGADFNVQIHLTDHWSANPFFSYRRLLGHAADAPITALEGDADQFQVGVRLIRAFNFKF